MDKFKRLSEAMEAGSPAVTEDIFTFLSGYDRSKPCNGCALGTAWHAMTGRRSMNSAEAQAMLRLMSKRFGISRQKLNSISYQHRNQEKTRAEIIAELKAKGL